MAELREPQGTLQQAEAEAGVFEIVGHIRGEALRVKNPKLWPSSIYRDQKEGNFDAWAQKILVPDDVSRWLAMDPTFGEIEEFIQDVMARAGVNPGK